MVRTPLHTQRCPVAGHVGHRSSLIDEAGDLLALPVLVHPSPSFPLIFHTLIVLMQVRNHYPLRRLTRGQALELYTTIPYFFLVATIVSFPYRHHRETVLPALSSVIGLGMGGSMKSISLRSSLRGRSCLQGARFWFLSRVRGLMSDCDLIDVTKW